MDLCQSVDTNWNKVIVISIITDCKLVRSSALRNHHRATVETIKNNRSIFISRTYCSEEKEEMMKNRAKQLASMVNVLKIIMVDD